MDEQTAWLCNSLVNCTGSIYIRLMLMLGSGNHIHFSFLYSKKETTIYRRKREKPKHNYIPNCNAVSISFQFQ